MMEYQPSLFEHQRVPDMSLRRGYLHAPAPTKAPANDGGLQSRLQKRAAAHGRWSSFQARMHDNESGGDDYETPEPHPVTGYPSWGSIQTDDRMSEGGLQWRSGWGVPHGVRFQDSAESARRRASTPKLVPTPHLGQNQWSVSSTRVHEILEEPGTTSNPRLPFKERPTVFEHPDIRGREKDFTAIDGHHRISAELMKGALFVEANVLTPKDIPVVKAHTDRITQAKSRAKARVDREGRSNDVLQREQYLAYGTGYY